MKTDPIVQQVREIRRQIDDETQHDPELYYQYLKKLQRGLSGRLVCPKPKPLMTSTKEKGCLTTQFNGCGNPVGFGIEG